MNGRLWGVLAATAVVLLAASTFVPLRWACGRVADVPDAELARMERELEALEGLPPETRARRGAEMQMAFAVGRAEWEFTDPWHRPRYRWVWSDDLTDDFFESNGIRPTAFVLFLPYHPLELCGLRVHWPWLAGTHALVLVFVGVGLGWAIRASRRAGRSSPDDTTPAPERPDGPGSNGTISVSLNLHFARPS